MASLKCLGIIFSILSAYAEPQQFSNFPPYRQHPQLMNARTNPIGSSLDISPDSRLFLGNSLITYTAFTTTTTTTVSSTTICTTSNAVISTCSPSSGRRRRRLALDDTYGRSLFFTNDDEDEAEYGDIFLPITPDDKQPEIAEVRKERESRFMADPVYPIVVQPGFNPPGSSRSARLFLQVATSTATITTTSTYTLRLIALCQSSTSFRTC